MEKEEERLCNLPIRLVLQMYVLTKMNGAAEKGIDNVKNMTIMKLVKKR